MTRPDGANLQPAEVTDLMVVLQYTWAS